MIDGSHIDSAAIAHPAEHRPQGGPAAGCPATILCIDDDPQISEAIALRLRQYGVDVLRAFHGTHGLWLAMTSHPDLMITDMRMPQGGGNYVIECLRHNPATRCIPIIVLTGQRDPHLEAAARQLGIEEFFTKPVRFDDLREVIQKVIPLHEPDPGECTGGL